MPDKPTAKKAKPRSAKIDDVTWQLFVRACGGRCLGWECDGSDTKLQQGHLERYEDGGPVVFENLIPLCASCNGKYSMGFTRDTRPDGWRDRFWKSMLAVNGIEIGVANPTQIFRGGSNTLQGEQVVENKQFIELQNVEFALAPNYITPSLHTPTRPQVSVPKATKLMWELFKKSKDCDIPPKPPLERRNALRQTQLIRLAQRLGEKDFLLLGEGFRTYEPCPWVTGTPEHGYAEQDSWMHLCVNPDLYLEEGRRLAANDAARLKAQREKQEEWNQQLRESRWERFKKLAAIAYSTTQEDEALIETVRAETVIRDVPDDEMERMRKVECDGVDFWRTTVMSGLNALYKKGGGRIQIAELVVKARAAKTIQELLDCQDQGLSVFHEAELEAKAHSAAESRTAVESEGRDSDSDIPF